MVKKYTRQLATRNSQRGFTFIELMLGMVISTMVAGATAAFMLAVTASWGYTSGGDVPGSGQLTGGVGLTVQSLTLSGRQAVSRIQSILRPARQTGTLRAGLLDGSGQAAALMVRLSADDPATIRVGELALLQYEPADKTVWLYLVEWPTGWNQAQINAVNVAVAATALTDPQAPESFKKLQYVNPRPLAHDVAGARFGVSSNSVRPAVEFVLKFARGRQSSTEYGIATLRLPVGG